VLAYPHAQEAVSPFPSAFFSHYFIEPQYFVSSLFPVLDVTGTVTLHQQEQHLPRRTALTCENSNLITFKKYKRSVVPHAAESETLEDI
jgi:hypothetical protein